MSRFLFSCLIAFTLTFSIGCFSGGDVSRFNLRMEGILVGQLDEIRTVYLIEGEQLLIPINERNGDGLVRFIGEDDAVELSLFLGETWMGDYTLHKSPSYSSLRIPYESKFNSILEAGGVELRGLNGVHKH